MAAGLQHWVTRPPFPDDLPSVPVFDRTLPVKQMHVLETLDLLILRADKGGAPPPPAGCALGGARDPDCIGHANCSAGAQGSVVAHWFSEEETVKAGVGVPPYMHC